jgi:3-oxoadipate enol-lactonase
MHTEVNGIRVNYRVDGTGDRWVTFVTGIANDLTMWDGQVEPLARDFRILRYDLRGHGGTQATRPPYTLELLVRDLVALLETLKIERTQLVGLGLGGALGQAAAIEHPERFSSLAACCCRARMVPDFAVMWHRLRGSVKANGLEAIVEPTVQRWFSEEFKAAHPQVLDSVRAMIRGTTLDGYLGVTAAFLELELEEHLPRIKARTLFLSGAEDKLGGPPELMRGLADKVPGARHASVPGAAHIANIQNPAGFNQQLVGFLKEGI